MEIMQLAWHALQVEIYSSFRPGDIDIAEVLSLGDARSYYLSTAKNELGVVYAKSVAGAFGFKIVQLVS